MQDSERIPTNLRTLLILEILGRSEQPMTATQINEQLGLPKQTVHRLCVTLEESGFLTRPGNAKKYQVARRLRELGSGLLYNSRDHVARHQILRQVSDRVGETVNYAAPGNAGMHYLDRVETDWPFRIQLPIGTSVPFHCTASGKTFLASLAPKKRDTLVASLTLDRKTPFTIVTPEDLLAELTKIRKQGYSVDREEFLEGMVAIAVPVLDPHGRYIASLAYHGPSQRVSLTEAIERKDILLSAAEKLSAALFE
ncbi:Acetate operon repressor [Tritonibacter multivorans]|uniref:Acetate operon repressor n=1 Tax=Tritonibacter multivorans TaxID=928856 RepID=A0A0P1GF79_9RHOB|nr:IclR family transcriptional regulator [Tritonibacter multivorans]MDA7421129.1 IclR family transcriptional regulator [Tritonibacter multivorans]CUH80114.1 Acetate operon repressor [Tritonibacter multivorans]SFC74278.1 transcriptional regulator, IclR family [Tritonibacter multivorans]